MNAYTCLLLAVSTLACGCSRIESGISGYYLNRAEDIIEKKSNAPGDIQKTFRLFEKSIKYGPSEEALEKLDDFSLSSHKSGFSNALEFETNILKKVIAKRPDIWSAYAMLAAVSSLRGDIPSLRETIETLEPAAANLSLRDGLYPARLSLSFAYCELIAWIDMEGRTNLKKDAASVLEKAEELSSAADKIKVLAAETAKLHSLNSDIKNTVSHRLLSYYEIAMQDFAKTLEDIKKTRLAAEKINSDPALKTAFQSTVNGNMHMAEKKYSMARAAYAGALSEVPGFMDAKHQLASLNFQEGARQAAAGDISSARNLLNTAYAQSSESISYFSENSPCLPFQSGTRLLAEAYSLRAASLSAIHALKPSSRRQTAAMEKEFKESLNSSLKLNPEGTLAREMLDNYTKNGF